ncbi:SDR family oxidoreductase [Vibrio sp. 10N.222.54.A1]|uniref:SDR family oxidoreductase n=1 Tax=unclassified Vibrio TaxID=2614977 RepID=UPI000C8521F0|nr:MULTISPECIES: SDR family oxidoreductase [unclassified Vibrio]PMK81557.1 clavaldehyde dehydrogenase [Vibrio sp. 10N.261.52.E5]TKF85399.1 SDR family oxidoreductase [Vibrio sp. F13]
MKSILITGGNGDIAKKLVRVLSEDYLVFSPLRSELDVSNSCSVEEYFNGKSFDIVINAAGTLYSSLVADSEPEQWINDINVNLIGTYLVSRLAVQRNRNCLVINLASTAAFNHYKDWTSYCASKAGVVTFSKGMALDGYNVIILCPGAIDTKLRGGLNIINNNIMTLDEAVAPVLDAISGLYHSGDIVFYRKGTISVNPPSDIW